MLLQKQIQRCCSRRDQYAVFVFIQAETCLLTVFSLERKRTAVKTRADVFQAQAALQRNKIICIVGHAVCIICVGHTNRNCVAVCTARKQYLCKTIAFKAAFQCNLIRFSAVRSRTQHAINCCAAASAIRSPHIDGTGVVRNSSRIDMY